MEAARQGHAEAFEQLVRLTYADTYTLAYRLTGSQEDALDVVQDTYLRAYRAIGGFRGDARFTTWLYRITANCASTHQARGHRHRHDELAEADQLADLSEDSRPGGRLERLALRDELEQAIVSLPPALRSVVVLRDIYALPHEAIAAELGISVTAAKVRLHRARRRLREQLGGIEGQEVADAR